MTHADILDEKSGICTDPGQIYKYTSRFGLLKPSVEMIREGRDIAAQLIDPNISTAATFLEVQQLTEAALHAYVEADRLTGMLSFFALNEAGHVALKQGEFDGVTPDHKHICRPHERPAACYGWGIVGLTHAASKAVMATAAGICNEFYWALPIFVRVATEDGRRAMIGSLGLRPLSDDSPDMVFRPAHQFPPKWSPA